MPRNIALDYFKLILSGLVVLIHLQAHPISLEFLIGNGIARIAVPCFFIINGYFLASIINDKSTFRQYIKRLIILYVAWMFIFSGFYIDKILHINSFKSLCLTLLLLVLGYYHIWYIAALIYASLLLKLVISANVNKYIILVVSFILFSFVFFVYALPLIDTSGLSGPMSYFAELLFFKRDYLIRNFLFMGFPFLFIGYFIHTNIISLPKKLHIALIIILSVLLLTESRLLLYFCNSNGVRITNDFRLSLFFLCPLIVLFFVKYPLIKESDGFISKLASAIFFIHPLILFIIDSAYNSYQYYFIILFLSVLLGTILITLNKKFKIFL